MLQNFFFLSIGVFILCQPINDFVLVLFVLKQDLLWDAIFGKEFKLWGSFLQLLIYKEMFVFPILSQILTFVWVFSCNHWNIWIFKCCMKYRNSTHSFFNRFGFSELKLFWLLQTTVSTFICKRKSMVFICVNFLVAFRASSNVSCATDSTLKLFDCVNSSLICHSK